MILSRNLRNAFPTPQCKHEKTRDRTHLYPCTQCATLSRKTSSYPPMNRARVCYVHLLSELDNIYTLGAAFLLTNTCTCYKNYVKTMETCVRQQTRRETGKCTFGKRKEKRLNSLPPIWGTILSNLPNLYLPSPLVPSST